MEKDLLQEYTARISQASRGDLVVIIYELILHDLKKAREHLETKRYVEYEKKLTHASKCVNELMGILDYQYDLSKQLMSMYIYIGQQIVKGKTTKNSEHFSIVEYMIESLKIAYEKISMQESKDPVMQNTQQIYAGLTYGVGTLNEVSVSNNEINRGFRV